MSNYRYYGPVEPALFGYDPAIDLPANHLARFVEQIVEEVVQPEHRTSGQGQGPYDPRLCIKVLIYAYANGVRSSRQIERLCAENLPLRLLTRGDTPSYRTLCTARIQYKDAIESVWEALFQVAYDQGIRRLGKLTLDSTKIRADAGTEAVLTRAEYEPIRLELERILAEAATVDAREDSEGQKTQTVLPKNVPVDQMREILRRVRLQKKKEQSKQEDTKPVTETTPIEAPESPSGRLGPRMQVRIEKAIAAIADAEADGRKHLCLTDPDARMLAGESSHNVKEFHSFEIAVDQGLIVASSVTTDQDNSRAVPLVDAALAHEAGSVVSVTADSGYWRSDAVLELEGRGIDTCIPDSFTACDLHKGHSVGTTLTRTKGKVSFEYDASEDCYSCPEKNRLVYKKNRWHTGRELKVYQAERECTGCPRAADCLANKDTKRRSLHVYIHSSEITAILARFSQKEHRERYWDRGPAVETVFGFMRSVLGFTRWMVRGAERVRCEAVLFQTAYQFRKLHRRMTLPQMG